MSSQKIKFGDKEVDKKAFYSSKEAILLDYVDLSKIVVSSRWKLNDEKYDEIWNVVKGLLKLKFAASPIRNDKYILAKLKTFRKKNLTTFNNNIVPIEKNNFICIPAIDIDSVLKIDKKAYPQAYLEECKYKLKKRKLLSFINSEIIDDSDIHSDNDYQYQIVM